jgi:hypothetical protein
VAHDAPFVRFVQTTHGVITGPAALAGTPRGGDKTRQVGVNSDGGAAGYEVRASEPTITLSGDGISERDRARPVFTGVRYYLETHLFRGSSTFSRR